MAAGVRFGERESRARLEGLIARTADGDDRALRRIPHSGHRGAGGARLRDERGCGHDQRHLDGHAESDRRGAGRHAAARRRGEPRRRAASTSRCPARRSARRRCRTRNARSSPPTKPRTASPSSTRGGATVLRVLPGGSDPEEFDVDAAGGRLFVSNEDAGELSIVDLATGEVLRTVKVGGEPEGVRLRPDRAAVYVTSESDHAVTVVDARERSRARQHRQSAGVRGTRSSPRDGSRAYVSSEHGGSVAVVDVAANEVLETIALPAGSLPMGLALVAGRTRLYVANGRARTVSVIDLANGYRRRRRAGRRSPVGHRAHVRRQVSVHGQRLVERRFGHRHRVAERRRDDSRGRDAMGHRDRPTAARTLRSSSRTRTRNQMPVRGIYTLRTVVTWGGHGANAPQGGPQGDPSSIRARGARSARSHSARRLRDNRTIKLPIPIPRRSTVLHRHGPRGYRQRVSAPLRVRKRRSADVSMPRDAPPAHLPVPLSALAACADAEPLHHRRVTWIRAHAVEHLVPWQPCPRRTGQNLPSVGACRVRTALNRNLDRTTPPGCPTSTATRFR